MNNPEMKTIMENVVEVRRIITLLNDLTGLTPSKEQLEIGVDGLSTLLGQLERKLQTVENYFYGE